MDHNNRPAPMKQQKHHKTKLTVQFNAAAMHSYVTGFRQRRLERQRHGALEAAAKMRVDKIQARKQRKQAFMEELGDLAEMTADADKVHNAVSGDMSVEQNHVPIPASNDWRYEDDNAVVTVVTKVLNDDSHNDASHRSAPTTSHRHGQSKLSDHAKLNTANKPLSAKSKLIQKHDTKKHLRKKVKQTASKSKSKGSKSHSTPQRKFHKKNTSKKKK